MSELPHTLKILVTRYPGTMAELARKASIDRSTWSTWPTRWN